MASLSEVEIPTVEVAIPGGDKTLTVRGLSTEDLYGIYSMDSGSIETLYKKFKGTKPEVADIAQAVLSDAPTLAANIIAVASGSPGLEAKARQLPAMVQLRALIDSGSLTLTSVAEVKKIVEMAIQVFEGIQEVLSMRTDQMEEKRKGQSPPKHFESGYGKQKRG